MSQMSKKLWVTLSDGQRVRRDAVAAVVATTDRDRLFLKSRDGEILASMRFDDPEELKLEMTAINEQIDR